MNRRQIFSRLSALIAGLVAVPKLGWAKFEQARSSLSESLNENGEFVTVREFQSLLYPQKLFKDVQDFWSQHPDQVSDALKSQYYRKGLLTSNSELLADRKTVRQTKVFKSEAHFRRYQKSMKAYYSTSGQEFKESLKRIS